MKICCIPVEVLPKEIISQTNSFKGKRISDLISEKDVCWIERKEAENNNNYKQLIPYILVKNENKFACYKRHGTEQRLHGLYSCGIGGHVDEPDKQYSLEQTLETGMYRELSEEFCNFEKESITLNYLGLINENESNVGLVHLGIVFLAECNNGFIPKPAEELSGMEWKTEDEVKLLNKELWTELAFNLL